MAAFRLAVRSHRDDNRNVAPDKLRDLHFDLLSAFTARSHGALLITSDRADLELLSAYGKFHIEVWYL